MEEVAFKRGKNFPKSIRNPLFVVGLPGIGNVGKIVVDYAVEQLNAEEIGRFYIDTPPMVFPTEEAVEFPSLKVYYKASGGNSVIFLAGDYQPRDKKCFHFCKNFLNLFKKLKGKEILVFGGASLSEPEASPLVYYITSNVKLRKKYSSINGVRYAFSNLGPIVGVAGVLVGMAKEYGVDASAFLTETSDKEYFNTNSVKTALTLLNKVTKINVDAKKFNARVNDIKKELGEIIKFAKEDELIKKSVTEKKLGEDRVNYIG